VGGCAALQHFAFHPLGIEIVPFLFAKFFRFAFERHALRLVMPKAWPYKSQGDTQINFG